MRNTSLDVNNITVSKRRVDFFTKRLSEDEKEELMCILIEKDSGYQIEWVAQSLVNRRKYSESRRKNRLSKTKKDMKTYDSHMENESESENEIKNESKDLNTIDPEILKLVTNFYDYQYPNYKKQLRQYKSNPDILIFDSAQVIEKIMRIDGYEIKDILMTLEFAVHDEFWSPNVISLRGLRKRKDGTTKFDKVYSKMKQSRKTGLGAIEDWVRSREAGEPMSTEWMND